MVVCSGPPMALAQGFSPRLPVVSQFESPALSPTAARRQRKRPAAEAMGRHSVSLLILRHDPPAYLLDTIGVPPPVTPRPRLAWGGSAARRQIGWRRRGRLC
jgi:hypothetical protein